MRLISQNKFLLLGLVVLIVGGVWYGLSQSSAPEPQLLTTQSTSSGSPTQENADQQLVATLLTLRSVTLSGNIFQDPAFVSLRDFGTTIVSEPIGRTNPFAPITSATPPATTPTAPQGGAR